MPLKKYSTAGHTWPTPTNTHTPACVPLCLMLWQNFACDTRHSKTPHNSQTPSSATSIPLIWTTSSSKCIRPQLSQHPDASCPCLNNSSSAGSTTHKFWQPWDGQALIFRSFSSNSAVSEKHTNHTGTPQHHPTTTHIPSFSASTTTHHAQPRTTNWIASTNKQHLHMHIGHYPTSIPPTLKQYATNNFSYSFPPTYSLLPVLILPATLHRSIAHTYRTSRCCPGPQPHVVMSISYILRISFSMYHTIQTFRPHLHFKPTKYQTIF